MTLTLSRGTRVVVNNGGVCPVQISDVFCAKFFADYSLRKLARTFSFYVRVVKNKFASVAHLDAVPAASGIAAVAAVVNDNFSHNVFKRAGAKALGISGQLVFRLDGLRPPVLSDAVTPHGLTTPICLTNKIREAENSDLRFRLMRLKCHFCHLK